MTARDQARYLTEHMPAGLFGGVGVEENQVAWRLSPEPFWLSPETFGAIERSGPDLVTFYRALASLYQRSARGTAPAFIADYLDRGKPEASFASARQNRFKSDIPGVIRPDLILTDGGFIASELDSVPGGMGFVGAMARAYCELGYDTVGGTFGMPRRRSRRCSRRPAASSVRTRDRRFRRVEELSRRARLDGAAPSPSAASATCTSAGREEIVFTEEALFVRLPDGREEKIDVLYRNFELFDLLNVPKWELMFYAARHNRVQTDAAAKAHLEEKSSFALLHNPCSKRRGSKNSATSFARLRAIFPQTWVLDPRPLPPQAVVPGITAAGAADGLEAIGRARQERARLRRRSRPASPNSPGVRAACASPTTSARKIGRSALDRRRLASFDRTPWILQRFHKGKRVKVPYYDERSDDIAELDGRVRLCPYYFVVGDDGAARRHSGDDRTGRQAAHPRHERGDHGTVRDPRGRLLAARGSDAAVQAVGRTLRI